MSRFNTAAALQTSALHLEIKNRGDPLFTHIVNILRKEAEDLIELGLQELKNDAANSG